MYITARINGEGGPVFRLCSWSSTEFATNPVLRIQSDDLSTIKDIFDHITKVEIYVSGNAVAAYTAYDTYETITYAGKVFVTHENVFCDCMEVHLVRSSLADEIARIDEIVNPIIDIDAMTTEEYRDYLLKQIGQACRADIYDGTQVLLTDGTVEKYTYNDDDQRNLTNAMAILIIAPELPSVPYHPSGGFCRMIPSLDLLTIYTTLQLRLTYLTTRCNFMRMWIKSINSKEELLTINWHTDLPEEYEAQVYEIYQSSLGIIQAVKEKFMPPEPEPEPDPEDPEPDGSEPDGSDEPNPGDSESDDPEHDGSDESNPDDSEDPEESDDSDQDDQDLDEDDDPNSDSDLES